jgi:3' terminal RNA ribose 2'-O-methyltransferase Hen1
MLLTITCQAGPNEAYPATDLGFLLHKNPATLFEKPLSFGTARVFYPHATPERCTCALLVAIDPVGLVRGNRPAALAQYVSDRPYAPSSFLSVALAEVFGTALGGRSKERPELAQQRLALSAELPALACDGGEDLIRDVFVPLGYDVRISRLPLDPRFPAWGPGALYAVGITGAQTVQALLSHLAVLVPVLDNAKHYFVGDDEVNKLVRRGEGWLGAHPAKELIARRYLRYKKSLTNDALARLAEVEGVPDADEEEAPGAASRVLPEPQMETPRAPERAAHRGSRGGRPRARSARPARARPGLRRRQNDGIPSGARARPGTRGRHGRIEPGSQDRGSPPASGPYE